MTILKHPKNNRLHNKPLQIYDRIHKNKILIDHNQSLLRLRKPSHPSYSTETLIRLLEGSMIYSSILLPRQSFYFFFFPSFLVYLMVLLTILEFSSPLPYIFSPLIRSKGVPLPKIQTEM